MPELDAVGLVYSQPSGKTPDFTHGASMKSSCLHIDHHFSLAGLYGKKCGMKYLLLKESNEAVAVYLSQNQTQLRPGCLV
jgi:hypothetical protein